MDAPTPLTVVGGYLGAGKTTLINRLLGSPGGRRIGVIVNDFGSVPIDADLLADARTDGDVIGLANGCVCCTVGAGLHEALGAIVGRGVDHVVIEVSGVADPAVAAAWATVPPFEPAGVIVLVAADQVMRLRRDRYVGDEVVRQVAGADLLLVTKVDRCDDRTLGDVEAWLAEETDAPVVRVIDGDVPVDVVLGVRPDATGGAAGVTLGSGSDTATRRDVIGQAHDAGYASWTWSSDEPVRRDALDGLLAALDPRVLRLKGWVAFDDGSGAVVQVVGRTVEVRPVPDRSRSRLVAIALAGAPDPFALHFG